MLEELGTEKGMLGLIFRKAQNKIQDPAKLRRLIVDLIDERELVVDGRRREGRRLRGAAGEERAGHQVRGRPVLHAAAADPGDGGCIAPEPGETICDPACGTGGFLLAAHDYIVRRTTRTSPRTRSATSKEAPSAAGRWCRARARLCAMNLMLHGIGSENERARSRWPMRWRPTRASASTWC